ncbi:alpha/beta-hydrolase [Aspergillus steynii IBT 23096]|uniref:Alpha/beta-hydrolase n=1 Tax=Aspergillus steynii IBT 23096 TaxID=1392250 RepID=A0A2I2FUV8_9EURO|nr:alpha/beta-hydrolase [Aspergillus steynii IBT 23096]PLB44435.1 alpha/beta-hydrolase [Aspergillus steynii IBT 23096]
MPPYFILKPIAFMLRLLRKLLPAIRSFPDEVKSIPSRDAGRSIKIHIYRPPPPSLPPSLPPCDLEASNPLDSQDQDQDHKAPPSHLSPVHLNLCGSGFVMPGHGLDDAFCRRLTTSVPSGLTIIDIEYRLSPENPFPAALHDAEDVLRWVQSQPETYDAARISIGGFSAGGALAVSLAGHMPKDTFSALVAFYPACDASVSPFRKKAPEEEGRPLPGWLLWVFQGCYLSGFAGKDKVEGVGEGEGEDGVVHDTRVSPALMRDLSRFPNRCLFVTAGQCSLAGEAEGLGERVKAWKEGEGESRVVVQRMQGCGHAWDKFAKDGTVQWEMKERAYAMAVEMLT